MNERDLSVLTERQRTAYMLKESGMSVKKIGEEMGITPSAVRQLLQYAERRLQQVDIMKQRIEENVVPVDFPLTRADLLVILSGLQCYTNELMRKEHRRSAHGLERELPLAIDLTKRIKIELYGKSDITNVVELYE